MENSTFITKGRELEARGDQTLQGSYFGNFFTYQQDRADQAKDLFVQAAHCYKLSGNIEQTIACYEKCIQCEADENDAAPHYKEAAMCVKETDPAKYVEYIKRAIDLFSLSGRTSQAAGLSKDCAQHLEEEYDYEAAATMYAKAAQLYQLENQTTQAQSMTLKSCELQIMCKEWSNLPKIIKTYESIANKYLNTPILKSSAKDLFFLSCLCFMANEDVIGAKQKMQQYGIDDPAFDGSREQVLVQTLVDAIQNENSEDYQVAISTFNQMTPFSKMKTSMLVKVKEIYLPDQDELANLQGEEPDFRGGEPDFTGGTDSQIDSSSKPQENEDDYDFR